MTKEFISKEEINKFNFYKIKDNDKLTLTGKQIKEFAEFNRQEATNETINKIKGWENLFEQEQIGREQAQEEVRDLREIINKIKTKYCPMCANDFDDCNCNVPAFSVKWLRERLKEIK